MKRFVYALLAAGFLMASCGFVVAEKRPDAVRAQYPARIDLGDSKGMIRSVAAPEAEVVPDDPESAMIEDLNPGAYSEVYYDDDYKLTISYVDRASVEKTLQKHGMKDRVRLVEGVYSRAQLDAAQEAIFEKMEEYDIVMIAQMDGGLRVGIHRDPPVITQAEKDAIMALADPVKDVEISVGNGPLPKNT